MDCACVSCHHVTNCQVFHESRVTVWSSVHSLAEGSMGGSRDGFHMSDIATSKVMVTSKDCVNYNVPDPCSGDADAAESCLQ